MRQKTRREVRRRIEAASTRATGRFVAFMEKVAKRYPDQKVYSPRRQGRPLDGIQQPTQWSFHFVYTPKHGATVIAESGPADDPVRHFRLRRDITPMD